MTNIAALPALALIVSAAAGVYAPVPLAAFAGCAAIGWLALTIALMAPRVASAASGASLGEDDSGRGAAVWIARVASVASVVGFFGAGAALAAVATREELTPPILDAASAATARGDPLKRLLSGKDAKGFTSPRCRGEGRVRGVGADSCTVRRT